MIFAQFGGIVKNEKGSVRNLFIFWNKTTDQGTTVHDKKAFVRFKDRQLRYYNTFFLRLHYED